MLSGFLSDLLDGRFSLLSDLLSDFGPIHAQIVSDQKARKVGQSQMGVGQGRRAFRRLPARMRARARDCHDGQG